MTRKEILEWGYEMADKIFHKKKDEMTIKGWIARDLNGFIYYYSVKPRKSICSHQWHTDTSQSLLRLPNYMFPSVKWGDEEPTPCKITIELKK